ncbi:MAG: aminotransferase class I/II-fold pyridoxal phosphate-dependent enzyme [Herbinix sp.]|nr:aminotransferase class I/II-fold pyridoxal phosphate-dependent enzyme [Herbinix sp.]
MDRLYDKLISYNEQDYYPMHMPGHKRNTELMQMADPYKIDITEIEGFDNLHQAEGILKQLSTRLSRLYGAESSFPLVNGSTVGILAGISAATNRGDKVLLARNCHKSVYHAVVLMGLVPIYCYPPQIDEIPANGGIYPGEVEEVLINNKEITLVVITSPTYEGIVSDIKAISEAVHRHGALLLVDEAHGAHFGFHEDFPKSAVGMGADIVIQSLHKTLPAFTQTAVLHSNLTRLNNKIEKYLNIYQSSSPSYLLLAGIDRCISILEDQGQVLFSSYYRMLKEFYHSMKDLQNLKLLEPNLIGQYAIYDLDLSKITISVRDTQLSGHQLQTILREKYHIIMEMETPDYVLGMTSICDTKEGFSRLSDALVAIDRELTVTHNRDRQQSITMKRPVQVMPLAEAMLPMEEYKSEQIQLDDCCDRVSAAFISMYPPGTPLIVPGERIDKEILNYIKWIQQEGITITGLCGEARNEIEVVCSKG